MKMLAALALVLIYAFTTPYMAWASLAYFCMVFGISRGRRHRKLHIYLMLTGVVLDLSLVLFLQFTRDAIATAMGMKLGLLPQLHIIFSTAALVLYFPTIYFGSRYYTGRSASPVLHRKLGILAFALRSIGFLLMFSMLLKDTP